MNIFIIMIIGSFFQCLYDIFITDRISKREAKKSRFDCSICNNWRCYYHYCKKEREKREL